MDEENVREQPQVEESADAQFTEGSLEEAEKVEDITSEAEKGGPLGKFKNVDDLYDAYKNLQAEFTRKSQKLAELQKEKMNKETSSCEENFKSFLSRNQQAFPYAEEIRMRWEKGDENLKNDVASFDKIWAGMLYEKLLGDNRAKEPLVQNLILNDDNLQKMVVENYMKQLQKQGAPIVISSEGGETVTKPIAKKPDTFEDAKRVVLELLD